jgi:hypothetical protein
MQFGGTCRILCACVVLALVLSAGVGVASGEQFKKTFEGNGQVTSVIQTSDGGYALGGASLDSEIFDALLIKTDADGNEQWRKTFGGEGDGVIYSVIQTPDGGYTLAGWTDSPSSGGSDAWLIRTDANGNEQWNKTFKSGGFLEKTNDKAYSAIRTPDGGYALAGQTKSSSSDSESYGPEGWLIKTDSNGNKQWEKRIGGWEEVWSVTQTSDGGFAVAGESGDATLTKRDPNGDEKWSKSFADLGVAYSVIQTSDGGFVLTGGETLLKTDSEGDEQWNKTVGGSDDTQARSVVRTSDGGFAVAGWTGTEGWLIKTDSKGSQQWRRSFKESQFGSVIRTSDGDIVIAGTTPDSTDPVLVKVPPRGPLIPSFLPNTVLGIYLFGSLISVVLMGVGYAKRDSLIGRVMGICGFLIILLLGIVGL